LPGALGWRLHLDQIDGISNENGEVNHVSRKKRKRTRLGERGGGA
jgi:hypothetical protein